MGTDLPPELPVLLDGSDLAARDRAWTGLLARYHRLLMKAAGAGGGGYDARMDRYWYMVEALAADDHRRLRAYHAQARSSFAAWLTVVARRLCVDHERARSGRGREATDPASAETRRMTRRRLLDLAGVEIDPDLLASDAPDKDAELDAAWRHEAIEKVLAELEPRDRLLLRLRYQDDLPVRRIADIMRFPTVFHVYRRLHAVQAAVREGLRARGIEGRDA